MQNLKRILASFVNLVAHGGRYGGQVADEVVERVRMTVRLIIIACLIPVAFFVVGLIVGSIGEAVDSTKTLDAARFILALGGFIGALLMALAWFKGVVYIHLAGLIVRGARSVFHEIPDMAKADIESFLRWARGWTAWFTGACLYAVVTPIWTNWYMTVVAATCLLGMSAIMSAGWTPGTWGKRILSAGVVSIFMFATVTLFVPNLVEAGTEWVEGRNAAAATQLRRETRLNEVDRAAEAERSEQEARLLKQFTDRRSALRRRAIDDCEGEFCAEGDRVEYERLGQKIARLRDGTYWEPSKRSSRSSEQPSKATASAAPVKGTASGTARLAPPPSLPGGAPSPERESSTARPLDSGGGGGSGPVPNIGGMDWDYILAPLPPRRQ